MVSVEVSGTEGYADEASALVGQYESISFTDVHKQVLHLVPAVPATVLDVGSGTGRDAAALAAMGHRVVAVEPTPALRAAAKTLHPSPRIEWLDDSLPHLAFLGTRSFDLVMLTAVWMHLDVGQRAAGMRRLARLVRSGGTLIMSLRHGPVPHGRRMFEVSAAETIDLASLEGFRPLLKLENQDSLFGRADVSWSRLAFLRAANSA
jgi:SAM-dependent methyltransferase